MDDKTLHQGALPGDAPGSPGSRTVGPYRLSRLLGEGGMGEVWLAEQLEPIRRQVAIKLIKPGMDTRRVVARFEAERQALALMQHPAIAKVLDGGSTPDGRPYFAMELVEGIPLHQFCDRHRLDTRQRLELFLQVCEGVQHAHQKTVIHRDLKPSNVLVETVDGRPQPRIIDFGIAKATGQALSENALTTEFGALVGTPEYMSPEQADPGSDNVDTRADVYALGVMLYELLCGYLPFSSQALRGAGPGELRRRLLETEPTSPSARLRSAGDEALEAAERRGTPVDTLARELRGDLDAVVLKAMEKDREHRYQSAAELAADIGRALRHEPVLAKPASTLQRLGKYVRRHRLGVALASGAGLSLVAFTVALGVQVRTVSLERDRANREAAAATRIAAFLAGIFKVSDPGEARGNSVTAREVLDRAAREIETGLGQDPVLQARLMDTMGSIYSELGLFDAARPLLQRALEARTRLLGPDAEETLRSRRSWGNLLYNQRRPVEHEAFGRESVERSRRVLGPDQPLTLDIESDYGWALLFLGRYPEAEAIFRRVLEAESRGGGSDPVRVEGSRLNLAGIIAKQGRFAEAAALRQGILESYRSRYGPDDPKTYSLVANQAADLELQGDHAAAERFYLQALESVRRVLGPDHTFTLEIMTGLANARAGLGRYSEAEKLNLEVLAAVRRVPGRKGREVGIALYNLACEAAMQRHRERALSYLREAVELGMPAEIVSVIDQESDLASLRGDRTFEGLVARAKANPAKD